MRKRIGIAAIAALFCCGVVAAQSEQIVYIDGSKYIVYTVTKGDTLYSLSKRYGTTIESIAAANPALSEGLKSGQTIKIPQTTAAKKQKAEKRSKRQFKSHTVVKGDTFYSIARKYEISVDVLMEDNAGVDPAHLAVGQTLYIRRSEIGLTDQQEAKQQIEEQRDAMNSVTVGAEYSYHLVHSGESAAEIAERFDTTLDALLTLNGFSSAERIREGLIIKVPRTAITVVQDSTAVVTAPEPDSIRETKSIKFRNIPHGKRAEVALMLPIAIDGKVSQQYLDFYQGFLLGADHLRMDGYQSHIDLYNTAHDLNRVTETIESGEIESADIIIGPVYEDTMIPVASYAAERSIPVVSPLANLTQQYDGNIFQMSPRPQTKYDKAKSLFDGSRRVVLITSDSVDKEFEAEIMQLLDGVEYTSHKYIYEHPSVIEKRMKALKEGEVVEPSPSDLSPLLTDAAESVFVILAGTEIEVDRILAALASANISLRARTITAAPYVVFGNNKWNRYRNIDRSLFFSNNVVMLSTYHIDRSNMLINRFSAQYTQHFGTVPSLYAYRGYDAAMVFIRALYSDMESALEGCRFSPLLTPYNFISNDGSGVRFNSEWVKVNYNSNFTITAE